MKIGFCNGCFDLLHSGHKYFLRRAHDQCDWLIVGVDSDTNIVLSKGEYRPVDPLETRLNKLADCAHVDAAIPFSGSVVELLKVIRPNVLFRGSDQAHHEGSEFADDLVIIPRIPGFSTTELAGKLQA